MTDKTGTLVLLNELRKYCMIRVFLLICLHNEKKKNETMKKAKERLDMSLEQQTGIPTEYLHQEAKITIDMDSTAESYLRRGISKQDFLKFVYQITELMEMSIKCGLQMDFDLKNIEVKDEQVFATSNFYIYSSHTKIGTDAKEHKVFTSES